MTFIGRKENLWMNQHKPYQCPTCLGHGEVWDRLTWNTDICLGCKGEGRLDTPWPPLPVLKREQA